MDTNVVAALALSSVVGLALGAFGGGGSIMTVPVLVYVARLAPSAAVGMSLAIVGSTSLMASFAHHRRRPLRFRIALGFGGAGIATAFLGARLTHLVPERTLMLVFAVVMLFVGGWMLFRRRAVVSSPEAPRNPRVLYAALAGAAVGGFTGFLGVGGGFLVVPALVAFTGLDMREAVGTSLLVIAINSIAGLLGHLGGERLDLRLAALFTALAIAGALVGERATRAVPVGKLRKGFALFVVAVGAAVGASTAFGGGIL